MSWRGLTWKEKRDGGLRRVGDIERGGAPKIGILTMNDDGDNYANSGVKGGPSGALNAARIMTLR